MPSLVFIHLGIEQNLKMVIEIKYGQKKKKFSFASISTHFNKEPQATGNFQFCLSSLKSSRYKSNCLVMLPIQQVFLMSLRYHHTGTSKQTVSAFAFQISSCKTPAAMQRRARPIFLADAGMYNLKVKFFTRLPNNTRGSLLLTANARGQQLHAIAPEHQSTEETQKYCRKPVILLLPRGCTGKTKAASAVVVKISFQG